MPLIQMYQHIPHIFVPLPVGFLLFLICAEIKGRTEYDGDGEYFTAAEDGVITLEDYITSEGWSIVSG